MTIVHDRLDSPCGPLALALRDGRLCALDFGEAPLLARVRKRFGDEVLRCEADPHGLTTRLRAYLAGDLQALDGIEVDPGGTPFQAEVWSALRRIPAGETRSYTELAASVGRPRAARAVGRANALNPVAIVLPCHRVVGADGSLTGYAGGLEMKRFLLRHEGAL